MMTKSISIKMLAFAFLLSGFLLTGCGGGDESANTENNTQTESNSNTDATNTDATASADAGNDGKGVGPIKEVEVGASINQSMATKGKETFEAKCTACHNTDETRKVGPGLSGVTERRKPEWIMNMILNPEKMVQEDPQAKELLAEYLAPMANQNLSEEEARSILEFFRQNDEK